LGKLYIVLSDEVERRFRFEVVKRLGGKKGDLSAAIEEALKDWLNKKRKPRTARTVSSSHVQPVPAYPMKFYSNKKTAHPTQT